MEESSEAKNILRQFENSINKNTPFVEPGFFNSLFFLYTNKVIKQGLKKPIDFDVLYKLREKTGLENCLEKYSKTSPKDGFMKRFLFVLGWDQFRSTFFIMMAYFCQIPIPIVIRNYLEWYQDPEADFIKGVYLALIFVFIVAMKPIVSERSLIYQHENTAVINNLIMVRKLIFKPN